MWLRVESRATGSVEVAERLDGSVTHNHDYI